MSAILPGLQAFSSAFNRIAMKKLLYILAGLGLAAAENPGSLSAMGSRNFPKSVPNPDGR